MKEIFTNKNKKQDSQTRLHTRHPKLYAFLHSAMRAWNACLLINWAVPVVSARKNVSKRPLVPPHKLHTRPAYIHLVCVAAVLQASTYNALRIKIKMRLSPHTKFKLTPVLISIVTASFQLAKWCSRRTRELLSILSAGGFLETGQADH